MQHTQIDGQHCVLDGKLVTEFCNKSYQQRPVVFVISLSQYSSFLLLHLSMSVWLSCPVSSAYISEVDIFCGDKFW